MRLRCAASTFYMLGRMRNLGYDEVLSTVTPRDAVDALREVLKGGFDPACLEDRNGSGVVSLW